MRRAGLWRAGIFTALTCAGCFGMPAAQLGFVGIGPAEAKTYYTKKRVNGRWITGRFAKRGSRAQGVPREDVPETRSAGEGIILSAAEPTVATPRPQFVEATVSPVQAAVISLSSNTPLVSAPDAERLGNLRRALQARASALTGGSIAEAARPAPEPQTVSLDFRSGIKTTLFSDGTTVSEPFDPAALRGLAAAPAAGR